MRRSWLVVFLLASACSKQEPRAVEVPTPPDWSLVAPEARAQIEEAIADCRRSPGDAAPLAELGRVYHGNHAPALAAAAYEAALAIKPDDVRTTYFLGLIQAERGETEAALASFSRAKDREPGYAPIRHHLGSALLEAGRPAEAVAAFEEAVRLEPKDPTYRVGLARALRQSGSLPEAWAAVEQALRADPDHLAANQVAALILKEQGRDAAASRHTEKSRVYRAEIVRDPWFQQVQSLGKTIAGVLTQADFFIENGKPESAVKALEPMARAHPARADVMKKLGKARALAGDFPRSRAAFARAVALDPVDGRTRADFASVLLDLGEVDAAEAEARAALAADPGITDARVMIASAKLRRGNASGALEELGPALAARPDLLLGHVTRGEALLALGRPAEAVTAFEAALALAPGMQYVQTKLAEARSAAGARREPR